MGLLGVVMPRFYLTGQGRLARMDFWWWFLWVGLALVVVGVGAMVMGRLRTSSVPDRTGWVEVPGTIVRWVHSDRQPPGGDATEHRSPMFPVVRYPLPDGTEAEFTNPTHLDTGIYRTGRQVRVVVDPGDPSRAELVTTNRDRRMIGCAYGGIGVVFVLLGLVGIVVFVMWLAATT